MISARNEPTTLIPEDIEIKWTWKESELLHFREMRDDGMPINDMARELKTNKRSVAWGFTSDEVWNCEKGYMHRAEVYVYASSHWATPAMEVSYTDGRSEMFECWILGDDSDSYFN